MIATEIQPLPSRWTPTAFDLADTGNRLDYDVRTLTAATVTAQFSKGTASAVLTVQRSIDGVNFYDLETVLTIGPTDGMSQTLDLSAVAYLRVYPSTAEASRTAVVKVFGKDVMRIA